MKKGYFMIHFVLLFVFLLCNTNVSLAQMGDNWIVVSEDTYSEIKLDDGSAADDNFGDSWRIRVRSDDDKQQRIIYLKFSLDGTNYTSLEDFRFAYIKLTIDRWYNQRDGYYATFSVYPLEDNTWSESTLTWNNQPWTNDTAGEPLATFSEELEKIGADDPVKAIVLDVSSYVKTQLESGNTTFSMVLADTTYGTPEYQGSDIRLFSKECVGHADAEKNPDESFYPYLVINENPRFAGYDRIQVLEDTYTEVNLSDGSSAGDNFGDSWRIRVRSDDNTWQRISYLKFSLDGTDYYYAEDVGEVFFQFTISKWFNQRKKDGYYAQFEIYPLEDNYWSELALTWNNQPWNNTVADAPIAAFTDTLGFGISTVIGSDDPPKQMYFDITDYVKAQLDAGNTTFSIVLADSTCIFEGTNPEAKGTDVRIYSKECVGHAEAIKSPISNYIPCLFVKVPEGTAVEKKETTIPSSFSLSQNYPNPFNPETTIAFSLAKTENVDITIVDVVGRKIRSLLHEVRTAGDFQVTWDGLNDSGNQVASGIYFTRLSTKGQSKMIKMLLVR